MSDAADVLIVHASRHGHSAGIAERIAERVRETGGTAELADVRHQPDVAAHGRRAVVVVASVHMDRLAEEVVSWLERWRHTLQHQQLVLLSVSLKAVSEDPEQRESTLGYVDALREAAGGRAAIAEPVRGALQYEQYNWVTRRMLRRIAAKAGLSTDTSVTTDYCDWEQIERIAQHVAAFAAEPLAIGA